MKKFVCVILVVLVAAGYALSLERHILRLGLLSKLNTTEEEFAEAWQKTFAPKNGELSVVVKFYDSLSAMQMALNAGEIQQMVLPEAVAEYVLNLNDQVQAPLVLPSKGMGLAFGFRAEDSELREKFNEALSAMQDDWTLSALEGVYIAQPGKTEPEPVSFARIDKAKTLKAAVTGDLPPIDFIASDGTPAGFNTAVLAEIANRLGVNIELVEIDSGARTAALASGRADVVFWYEVDTSSTTQADIPEGVIVSKPYYEWHKFIHIKKADKTSSQSSKWNIFNSILNLYTTER